MVAQNREPIVSARDQILADVRQALAGAPSAAPVDRSYRSAPVPDLDLGSLFCERIADYRAEVTRCERSGLEASVVAALRGMASVVLPEGLDLEIPGVVWDTGLSVRELDHVDAVVTTATVAVAETGTIVLTHGAGQGRRVLTLVPDLHVVVVGESQIVADVPAAFAALDPGQPTTWISGPSATSDIELQRVEGVHGPRTLRVIVLSDC